MSALLLDAGVWLAARDRDDPYHAESRRLVESDAELHALDLTLYEVANVAAVKWRSVAEAKRLVELVGVACGRHLVRADGGLLDDAAEIAGRYRLTLYDAAYVAAADRDELELISTDLRDLVERDLARTPAEPQP